MLHIITFTKYFLFIKKIYYTSWMNILRISIYRWSYTWKVVSCYWFLQNTKFKERIWNSYQVHSISHESANFPVKTFLITFKFTFQRVYIYVSRQRTALKVSIACRTIEISLVMMMIQNLHNAQWNSILQIPNHSTSAATGNICHSLMIHKIILKYLVLIWKSVRVCRPIGLSILEILENEKSTLFHSLFFSGILF